MKYDYTEVLKDLVRIDTTNPPGNEKIIFKRFLNRKGSIRRFTRALPAGAISWPAFRLTKMCLMKVGQTARRPNGR